MDIYASAAIVGAGIYYFMYKNHCSRIWSVVLAIVLTIIIRILASYYHLGLPKLPRIEFKDKDN